MAHGQEQGRKRQGRHLRRDAQARLRHRDRDHGRLHGHGRNAHGVRGAIVFGIGLIILAVNIRGDSPGGAPLIGAISMMVIGAALFVVGTYWGSLDTNWADQTIG